MNYSELDILYLTTKDIPDYLQDALYMGFRELGCNIVDFPRRQSLHGSWSRPEYHIEQLLFGFSELELRKNPDILMITGMFEGYGFCKNFEGWNKFVSETIEKYNPVKVVMLDVEDTSLCSYPILKKNYDSVFKRELMFPKPASNWHYINFSAIPEPFEYVYYPYRRYDISFVATMSNPYRLEVRDFILKKSKELDLLAYARVEYTSIDRAEYLKILSQSKTSVSVRGAGCECYRYWELPAKGLVMIADEHELPIENDFTDEQIFKFKNLNDLEQILIKLKTVSPEVLEEMALKSLQHTVKYHTPKKRAEYILRKVFNVS